MGYSKRPNVPQLSTVPDVNTGVPALTTASPRPGYRNHKESIRQHESSEDQRLKRNHKDYLDLEIRKFRRRKLVGQHHHEQDLLRDVSSARWIDGAGENGRLTDMPRTYRGCSSSHGPNSSISVELLRCNSILCYYLRAVVSEVCGSLEGVDKAGMVFRLQYSTHNILKVLHYKAVTNVKPSISGVDEGKITRFIASTCEGIDQREISEQC